MTARSNLRIAVLLAVVLFLNLSGICAAAAAASAQPSHSCCPKTQPVNKTSTPRCCMTAGVPESPAELTVLAAADCVALASESAPMSFEASHPVASHFPQPAASSLDLCVRFHQFLI